MSTSKPPRTPSADLHCWIPQQLGDNLDYAADTLGIRKTVLVSTAITQLLRTLGLEYPATRRTDLTRHRESDTAGFEKNARRVCF